MIVAMLAGIFVGFPISFTLIFLGLVFGYWGFGELVFYLLTLQFNATMMEQTLAAVPLFVFMGIMMEQANLMERLFDAVQKMLVARARLALPRGDVRGDDLRRRHRHRRRLGDDPRHHGRQVDDPLGLRREALLGPDRGRRHARHPDPALDHAGGDGAGARGAGDHALRRGDRARASCWR